MGAEKEKNEESSVTLSAGEFLDLMDQITELNQKITVFENRLESYRILMMSRDEEIMALKAARDHKLVNIEAQASIVRHMLKSGLAEKALPVVEGLLSTLR